MLIRNLNEVKYENESAEFVVKSKDFKYQYAPLYAERLARMRLDINKAAKLRWPDCELKNLAELEQNERCVIVGTLYKEMKNKPNILKELAEDESNSIPVQPVLNRDAKYIDLESDLLVLEDEVQRIKLIDSPHSKCGNIIAASRLCTGIVIGVLGIENEKSEFEVEDYCFKRIEFQYAPDKLPRQMKASRNDNYIVFVSGFELGDAHKTNDYLYKLQLLFDFLRGDFISDDEKDEQLCHMVSKTVRLIIVGNSLSSSTQSKDMINKAKYLTKNYIAGSVSAIKMLDEYLRQLIKHMDVDIMPGEFDPSNIMVPQQPLHHSMLTKSISSDFKYNLHTCTNPYRFTLDRPSGGGGSVSFVGTSGQFIDDIRRSSACDDPIELMRLTLECGHLGPTCPDTLPSYPYYGQDPFILDRLPNVYFAGNQAQFKSDVYRPFARPQGDNKIDGADDLNVVHMISLPKFSATNSCVFFNLNTFASEEMCF